MKKLAEVLIVTAALIGTVLVLGAVGELENGGDLFGCTKRILAGATLWLAAWIGQAIRQHTTEE